MPLFPLFLLFAWLAPLPAYAFGEGGVAIYKRDVGEEFLLQTSYERDEIWDDFMTSRSRIVKFSRHGDVLRVVEKQPRRIRPYPVLASLPIQSETARMLVVDFNAGFDRVFKQEDRTGEDYYGRLDRRQDGAYFPLEHRRLLGVSRHGPMLVVNQEGFEEDGRRVVVHYYLSPYRQNPRFQPFELHNLDHFGFYETYPLRHAGRTVLFAMKFDVHKPVVFALSARIPERYRQAVCDGVRYWNRAFSKPLLQVVDAPPDVSAPSPDYNVIEWVNEGDHASTSHIQSDPLTGEILHASIFLSAQTLRDGDIAKQNDHLRYVAAHEVGHALGLRHNFAEGPVSTVMNYFPYEQTALIGEEVIERKGEALEYDRKVLRFVYLGEPIDVSTLPAFCTDSQAGCGPRPALLIDRRAH